MALLFLFQEDDRWFIIIEPKDKKQTYLLGVFNTSDSGKKVLLQNRETAKRLAGVIEKIRTSVEWMLKTKNMYCDLVFSTWKF